mmetsp:Transcript_29536/g.73711  ORF Transcript_29536/g.73711 Transcript_29536/m.73711 type:complete len:246 (-) Transcript_29536:248-985(-)
MTRPPPAPLSGQQLLQECTYKESRSILVFLTAALTDSSLPARRIPRRASVAVSLSRLQRGTSVRVLDGRGGFHVRHPVRRMSGQQPHGVELVQCHAESEHLDGAEERARARHVRVNVGEPLERQPRRQDRLDWLEDTSKGDHDAEDLHAVAAHVHHEAHHADALDVAHGESVRLRLAHCGGKRQRVLVYPRLGHTLAASPPRPAFVPELLQRDVTRRIRWRGTARRARVVELQSPLRIHGRRKFW